MGATRRFVIVEGWVAGGRWYEQAAARFLSWREERYTKNNRSAKRLRPRAGPGDLCWQIVSFSVSGPFKVHRTRTRFAGGMPWLRTRSGLCGQPTPKHGPAACAATGPLIWQHACI